MHRVSNYNCGLLVAWIILLISIDCAGQTKQYIVTPKGRRITLYQKGDRYCMSWRQDGKTSVLQDAFGTMEYGHAWYPQFVAETSDYVLLRAGCGSPCWAGSFLPLKINVAATVAHEYLAYDLLSGYIAVPTDGASSDSIMVQDLFTESKKTIYVGRCSAAFIGYCMDTAYFKKDTLYYRWDPDATFEEHNQNWHKVSVR